LWSDFTVAYAVKEEELKRLNEALADDNSYSAVGFDYNSSNNTAEEESEASHCKFTSSLLCSYFRFKIFCLFE